jgi:hypothetical protein
MDVPPDLKASLESIYYIIGVFVVTGFSSLVAGIIFLVKKSIWLAKVEFRVERIEKDLNAAFQKLRDDQKKIQDHDEMKETLAELANILTSNKPKNNAR